MVTAAEPFRSAIREMARELSTRDIEALLADDAGKSLLSRTAVGKAAGDPALMHQQLRRVARHKLGRR